MAIHGGAEALGAAAHGLGRSVQGSSSVHGSPEPALRALPFDVLRRRADARHIDHRRGLWHRQTPQALIGRRRLKKRQGLFAAGAPVGPGRSVVHHRDLCAQGRSVGAHARDGRLHRRHRAAQTHKQKVRHRLRRAVAHPRTGVQRQGLAAPAVQHIQGRGLVQTHAHQRGLGGRDGQDLQADLGDHAQGAPAAGHQTADVVARHVFHDLPAKAQVGPTAVDHASAQDKVAHRTDAGAGRATQARRHHAADRRARAEVRRLEGQRLALFGQSGLQLDQGRAATGGDDKLAGLVADDALVAAGVEHLALQGSAPEILGATTAQAKLAAVGRGRTNGVDEVLALCVHGTGW